jgi:dGTP triphosphohydrolase
MVLKPVAAYRNYFKVERGWMEAANAIAYSMHCCEKTVRNAISDYEQLSAALPAEVIDAAELRGVDLARKRFLPAVKSVEGTINPNGFVSEEQASKVVDNIIAFKSADKTAKPPKPMPSIEDFADRMASFFEKLLNGASPEVREAEARFVLEYVNARLRTSIRELRQYGRPTLVPNPATRKEEMA